MKNLLILTAVLFLTVQCGSDATLTPEEMTGWKAHGLNGAVKTIKYNDGTVLEFNADGNLIYELKDNTAIRRQYDGPYRYTQIVGRNKANYDIIFPETNVRKERWESGTFEDLGLYYYFDNYGRLVSFSDQSNYSASGCDYVYKKNKDRLPYQQIKEDGWEEGSVIETLTYEYIDVDEHGNWTKRKVDSEFIETLYDNFGDGENKVSTKTDSFVEMAVITYFTDDEVNIAKQHAKEFSPKQPDFFKAE